jgi:phage terminase large subunit-like protein
VIVDSTHFTDCALAYCHDVVAGRILACKQVRQACERHLNDLIQCETDQDYPYRYDVAKAERVCKFVSKLPHVSGRWAIAKNNRFKLEPWQAFFLTAVFGWIEKATGYRRFREVLLSVPRKNGKSFIASAVCLYMFLCDGEPGSQVFAAANNFEQAMTVFRPAKMMIDQLPSLRNAFDIESNVKSLSILDGSRFVPLVGVARDGQSMHCAVLDEYHEAKDDTLYLSLTQSTGARTQPLMIIATTAGVTIEGPCHQLQRECEQVLDGALDRPELFSLIYTIDKDTDWTTEEALIMANPNLGVSVNLPALKTEHKNAIRTASKQNAFKTKKLNIWCNSATAFFNMADLSSKLDITAIVKVFRDGNKYYVFPRLYLPAERAEDPTLGMYAKCVADGDLTPTDGNVIGLDTIIDETVADIEKYKPLEFAFDKWHADLFMNSIGKRCAGLTLIEVPMEVKYLSPAMLELEAMLHGGTIRHNDNRCMTWMISNVIAHRDKKDNVYPRKAKNELKIDGPVALMLAISRTLVQDSTPTQSFQPFFV